MYLLLDTSTPTCKIWLIDGAKTHSYEWLAERTMAKGLLQFLSEKVAAHDGELKTLAGIGVFCGPGSFTGLRIGAATVNTLAQFAQIPVVGETGSDWRKSALTRLQNGQNDRVILPEYGRPARITQPKK